MAKLQFKPICHSWVALHPEPEGVVQFVGGAFFGTFAPMLFYRHLLQYFYDKSYSIIILPFNFSFNHYKEAFFLMKEQYALIPELITMAIARGEDPEIYLKADRYIWIGHSIGCKYIALLESAGKLPREEDELRRFIATILDTPPPETYNEKTVQTVVDQLLTLRQQLRIDADNSKRLVEICAEDNENSLAKPSTIPKLIYNDLFIKDQLSILLAPVLSDTSSAVQPKAFAEWLDRRGWGVQPTSKVTKNLIKQSRVFNLLVLAQLKSDKIALETIEWFFNVLNKPKESARQHLTGGHLRPLGFTLADLVINPWFDLPFITSVAARNKELETHLEHQINEIQGAKIFRN
jgi:hypothetical protein